ncbi:MAG: hypothetical protein M1832_003545 [Thelocarpon impressellum]|nr:MAG: hypothetical protein M1832_003545 [Thelocarpon impressellum]
MARNDVTVDIPLGTVGSPGKPGFETAGYSQQSGYTQQKEPSEKAGIFHRNNGRRKVAKADAGGLVKRKNAEGEEEILTRMGKIYEKIYNFSRVTRYFLYVLPLALLIAVPIVVGATATKDATMGGVRIVWVFTWVEIIWLSLWVSKLFASYTPFLFQFLSGIVSSGTRKYSAVLRALEIPLSLVGWAATSWATFIPLMTCNPDQRKSTAGKGNCAPHQRWQDITSSVFAALLVASLILLAEKLLVQLISISYHRKQFDAKIKTSKRNVYLLSLLYDASRALFPAYCNEFVVEDHIINDSIAVGRSDPGSHQRSGSATPMRLVQNIGRVGDKITSAFGNVAQEITGKQVFNPTAAHSIVVEALEKRKSSEALAKRLWMSFVVEGKESLFKEDLIEVLGADRQGEAEEAFDAIDADNNGDISLDEMIAAVAQFGRERHSIANSVHDVDQAIKVLDGLLGVIVFVLVILVFVGFLNASFTTTLATAGTALLSMSFVFASTAAEVLGSCIFLFVKHPFDVGDRVDISKEKLTVEHISLLFSVFKRVDNHKVVQIPNTVLNQTWIENVSRSKAMREQINLFINFDTTLEDINALKVELEKFVSSKENNRDYQPDIDVEIVGIAEMNKLELMVEIKHKSNWSNETLRAMRRSKFMCALVLALRKVPIYAPNGGDAVLGDLGKPTYSVAISDAEAAANREAFAAKKEAKRLFPSGDGSAKPEERPDLGQRLTSDVFKKSNESLRQDTRPSTAGASEKTAIDSISARRPGADASRDDWDAYRDELGTAGPERSSEESHVGGDLEEVRGLLRRESTRGRRKASAPRKPSVSVIAEVQSPALEQTRYDSASEQEYSPHDDRAYQRRVEQRDGYGSAGESSQTVEHRPEPVTLRTPTGPPPGGRSSAGSAFALTQHPLPPQPQQYPRPRQRSPPQQAQQAGGFPQPPGRSQQPRRPSYGQGYSQRPS